MELFHKMISGFLGIPERQISSTLHLLGEGATIPFISRYRKEATGGLDEVQIEQIKEQHDKLCDIAKRKETILGTITEQGKLTAELEKRINDTWNPTELEDIYLPYKPKRKTRAEVARQKGLEPLATILLLQRENNLSAKAASFVKGEVKDVEDALKGARDIIAEQVNEDERARNAVRNQFGRQAEITAKLADVMNNLTEESPIRGVYMQIQFLNKCGDLAYFTHHYQKALDIYESTISLFYEYHANSKVQCYTYMYDWVSTLLLDNDFYKAEQTMRQMGTARQGIIQQAFILALHVLHTDVQAGKELVAHLKTRKLYKSEEFYAPVLLLYSKQMKDRIGQDYQPTLNLLIQLLS